MGESDTGRSAASRWASVTQFIEMFAAVLPPGARLALAAHLEELAAKVRGQAQADLSRRAEPTPRERPPMPPSRRGFR